jgi:leucyl aminopeptidase
MAPLNQKGNSMNRSILFIFLSLLNPLAVSAHSIAHAPSSINDELDELRLIDKGDGQAQWMTFRDAMKLSEKSHESGRCGGFFDLTGQPDQKSLPAVSSRVNWFVLNLADRPMSQSFYLNSALEMINMESFKNTVQSLSDYKNRYYQSETGVESAKWIAEQFKKIAAGRTDVQVELFEHKWKQPSVIATIAGQGPHAAEVVVIGAHEDSINQSAFGSSNMTAPGADDDASGVATILEAFRVLVQTGFKPDRTLKFMTYAAEEVGLKGSQDIANHMKAKKESIVAVAQFDMTAFPGAGDQVVFMSDFVNPDLTRFSQKLMDVYVKARWGTDKCGYACSDHASWTKAGFPSVMPFEATMSTDNKAIHTVKDRLNLLDLAHGKHFVRLALSFVAELSKE